MTIQIKKTIKAGNSSAVILPRSWLNKEVRIELLKKTPEAILSDVIDILKSKIKIDEIIGIYLVGSYARNEEEENSDIDVLVITENTDKDIIKEGIYNILVISSKLLKQKLDNDILPLGPMLKEAKPLLNSIYLNQIIIKITAKNVKWYIKTTEEKLKIINEAVKKIKEMNKKYISDYLSYTIVLRIRTLYIIKKLMEGENYSKKDFLKLIKSIKGINAYKAYLSIKNNQKDRKITDLDEAERLRDYLRKLLIQIKKLIG